MKNSGLLVLVLAVGVSIIAIRNSWMVSSQKEKPTLENTQTIVLGNTQPPISSSDLQPKKVSSTLFEINELINTSKEPVEQLESYTQSLGHSFLEKNNLWEGTAKIEALNFIDTIATCK